MEFRVLKYFLMVAREENITHAAELLHITQPTLSRQMIQLEEELGVKLFQRSKHRIILTEDGMLLRRRAEEIVALAEKTMEDMQHKTTQLTGKISIGSGELKSSRFLAELIASFHNEHPQVQFEIYSGNSDNIKERIDRGILDLGLLSEPVDISKYNFVRTPFKERWGVLVNDDSELAEKKEVTPKDVSRYPIIMTQRELVRNELMSWFGDYADQLQNVAAGNLLYNMAALARCRLGIAVTIELNCSYDGLRFIPFQPALETGTVLVWKKAQIFSPAGNAFINYARHYLEDLAPPLRSSFPA